MIIRSHPKLHRLRSFFQDYTVAYYPDMPSKFGELLLRMPELQRVCQVAILKFKHIQTLPLSFSLSLFSSSSSCSHLRPDCCSLIFLWPCPCPLSLSHPSRWERRCCASPNSLERRRATRPASTSSWSFSGETTSSLPSPAATIELFLKPPCSHQKLKHTTKITSL